MGRRHETRWKEQSRTEQNRAEPGKEERKGTRTTKKGKKRKEKEGKQKTNSLEKARWGVQRGSALMDLYYVYFKYVDI